MTSELVTPGDVIGRAFELKARKGAYVNDTTIYASLTGTRRIVLPLPESLDQRATVEVTGHKAHGSIPEPGSVVIAKAAILGEMIGSGKASHRLLMMYVPFNVIGVLAVLRGLVCRSTKSTKSAGKRSTILPRRKLA